MISEGEIKQYLSTSLLSTSLSVNEMIFTDLLLNTLNTSHVLIDLLNVQVIWMQYDLCIESKWFEWCNDFRRI